MLYIIRMNMNQRKMFILLVTLVGTVIADDNWWHWTESTTGRIGFFIISFNVVDIYLKNMMDNLRFTSN